MRRTFLIVGILTLAFGLIACGGVANTSSNANAKPANAATTGANSAANTASNASAANTAGNTAAAPRGAAQDFTLVNKTGVIINALYISPADKDDWDEDILGKDQLGDGETLDITFDREEKSDKWDLKVEDSKGNSIEWTDLDLLKISKITLHYKDGKGTAEVE